MRYACALNYSRIHFQQNASDITVKVHERIRENKAMLVSQITQMNMF
jgi:hypothetical protein